jgi:hypothetical protein
MTLWIPLSMRTSLHRAGRLGRSSRIVNQQRFCFSSDENGARPLLLWLESKSSSETITAAPRILMPPPPPCTHNNKTDDKIVVSSANDVMEAVDQHYSLSSDENSQQFVGGMGEQDLGVWFASDSYDPLNDYQLIQDSIHRVKQYRHGVPFGVYTSGVNLPSDLPPLQELGLSRVQVSLIASNPLDYAQATGLSGSDAQKAFGQVCGYCVILHESGFPLEVAILQAYASSARDLAVSLGAVDTHVYKE